MDDTAIVEKLVAALEISRLGGRLGARVEGVDLSRPLSVPILETVRRALHDHCVLVFPRQDLSPDQLVAFASQWGELHMMPVSRLDGNPYVFRLEKPPEHATPGTDMWHSDRSCEERPPSATFLLSQKLPSAGGDTIFSSQYAAFEALSDGMKNMLRGLRAVHTSDYFNAKAGLPPPDGGQSHPVVRTHPETKRECLYVNVGFTTRFDGMTREESQPLLNWLYEHCSQPNFTFRHSWSQHDLLIWDNRCVQHYAVYDYDNEPRVMLRATVSGEVPA